MTKAIQALVLSLMLPLAAIAQVTHVTLWEPLPGKSADMVAIANKAVQLHQKLGAQSGAALDTMGRLHFFMPFEDWAAWGAYQSKMAESKEMQDFIRSYTVNPAAHQIESFMLDQPLSNIPRHVYNVFVWQPFEGRSVELLETALKAAAIHKKDGASVAVNTDQLGRVHYVMAFDSWEEWGAFQDSPSVSSAALMAEFQQNPSGKVVQTYMARSLMQ